MPELPEAETIVRSLRHRLVGRRIIEAHFLTRRVSRSDPALLAGRAIETVGRYGKNILLKLDRGWLLVDLRMTGRLLHDAREGPYTRAVLRLDRGSLLFDDVRQFGSVQYLELAPARLGPDPLEIGVEEFIGRGRSRNRAVKTMLLDQTFLRGLGNIYADEILHRAGIHPLARARRLSRQRLSQLHTAMRETLAEAIACRGSSVSDYVDGDGLRGEFQLHHRVYRKQGQPCRTCGAPIERIVAAQRGTHFCPACQRR
jgi:formamidopyrimidine-DNA glycosylase